MIGESLAVILERAIRVKDYMNYTMKTIFDIYFEPYCKLRDNLSPPKTGMLCTVAEKELFLTL
jgi:hypothetical protein